jgi:hypothetical protein
METPSLNLIDSSFEHLLHSNGLHLVSTYKYQIGNCLFDSISYLLDNHLSSCEPFQYINGLSRSSPIFQVHDSKVSIYLDDFASLSESMMQQPPIQLSQLTTCFYWNEKSDFA